MSSTSHSQPSTVTSTELPTNKPISLFSKALNNNIFSVPMPSILSPPMSPHCRLASVAPSSPGSVHSIIQETPLTSPVIQSETLASRQSAKRNSTPTSAEDNAHPLKKVKFTNEPSSPSLVTIHYKLPENSISSEAKTADSSAAPKPFVKKVNSTQQQQELKTVAYLRKLHEPAKPVELIPFGSYRLESFNPLAPLVSCCWDVLKKNPKAYLARERNYLSAYSRHSPKSANYIVTAHSTLRRLRALQPTATRLRRPNFNQLPFYSSESDSRSARNRKASSRALAAASSNALMSPSRPSTPVPQSGSSTPLRQPSTPKQPGRTSTPKPRSTPKSARSGFANGGSVTPSRVHDLSVSQLEDFAPSTSTLSSGKALRADWKGAPMDLSNDPDVHLLHPAEVYLASVLRLTVAVYLDSKKRLFAEKVHRLRQGLQFRRTDSQKACRIDVNKASRLFSAYEKVGWLEDDLFNQYL